MWSLDAAMDSPQLILGNLTSNLQGRPKTDPSRSPRVSGSSGSGASIVVDEECLLSREADLLSREADAMTADEASKDGMDSDGYIKDLLLNFPTISSGEKHPSTERSGPIVAAQLRTNQSPGVSFSPSCEAGSDEGNDSAPAFEPCAGKSTGTPPGMGEEWSGRLLREKSEGSTQEIGKEIAVVVTDQPMASARSGVATLLASAQESCIAHNKLREELTHYIKVIRARLDEDGAPSVAFPKNFDHVVSLMDRRDLAPREVCNNGQAQSGGKGLEARLGSSSGSKGGIDQHPWARYLLEEGLDKTGPFARYRGLFADEQTQESKLQRGLARMRELDFRLARTTEKARVLRRREIAENKEVSMALGGDEKDGQQNGMDQELGDSPSGGNSRGIRERDESDKGNSKALSSAQVWGKGPGTQYKGGEDGRENFLARQQDPPSTVRSNRSSEGRSISTKDRAFLTQRFRGSTVSSPTTATVGGTERGGDRGSSSSSKQESAGDGSRGSHRGSIVKENACQAGRVGSRLSQEQEDLISRLMMDDDGMDDKGNSNGVPSGIWEEIHHYGGAAAREDSKRLAEIDAMLDELRGGSDDKDDISSDKDSTRPSSCKGLPEIPGEKALRVHREERMQREREQAIDTAIEQLNEAVSDEMRPSESKERAVDLESEKTQLAPLEVPVGARERAGWVEELIKGGKPQPVGKWEVKRALQQGTKELRGKALASREDIEQLLTELKALNKSISRRGGQGEQKELTQSDNNYETLDGDLNSYFCLKSPKRSVPEDGVHNQKQIDTGVKTLVGECNGFVGQDQEESECAGVDGRSSGSLSSNECLSGEDDVNIEGVRASTKKRQTARTDTNLIINYPPYYNEHHRGSASHRQGKARQRKSQQKSHPGARAYPGTGFDRAIPEPLLPEDVSALFHTPLLPPPGREAMKCTLTLPSSIWEMPVGHSKLKFQHNLGSTRNGMRKDSGRGGKGD